MKPVTAKLVSPNELIVALSAIGALCLILIDSLEAPPDPGPYYYVNDDFNLLRTVIA